VALGMGPHAAVPMLLFMLAYAAGGLTDCFYYFFRGLDRTDLESTFTLAQRGLMFALALVILWRRPDVTLLGEAMLGSAAATLLAVGLVAWRLASERVERDRRRADPVGREFFESVVPIGIGVLLSALYFRIDVFLLERWSGTSAVALYNAVFRVVDALRLFPAAVLAVALPVLCRAQDLRAVVRLAAPLTAAALGASAVLWVSAGWLVPAIYGGAYADAVRPFRILVLAFPLMSLNYALTQQLIGWHGQRAYAVICAGALGFNLLLNWQMIPALGMNGAAWSTLWTEALLTIGCGIALTRAMPEPGLPLAMTGRVSLEDSA
jgi:O-antigen/teichoic acid export membrane protein